MGDSLLGRVRRGPILLVLATGNLLAVAAAVAAAGPISGTAPSRSTIGRTWPIAEPDALAEIEAEVATLTRDISKPFCPRDPWTGRQAAPQLAEAPYRGRGYNSMSI